MHKKVYLKLKKQLALQRVVKIDETYVGVKSKTSTKNEPTYGGFWKQEAYIQGIDCMINEKKTKVDASLGELLPRSAQTNPNEAIQILKTEMKEETIDSLIEVFEANAQHTEDGIEFWYARDLQWLLEYGEWRNFEKVLEKAKVACEHSGNATKDHFVEVNKMIELAKGAERSIDDYMLSRYACYLVAQNGDTRKRPVAFAQTYFAIQTRRQELSDKEEILPKSEDERRIIIRDEIIEMNKALASAASQSGIKTPQEHAIFQSKGYQGLYGKTVPEIRKYKGLSKSTKILDRMGSTELAANLFRVTQTEEKLRNSSRLSKNDAYDTHFEVGRQVREAMLRISKIAPEDLPVAEDISKVHKRILTEEDKQITEESTNEENLRKVDILKDLWKYVLLVLAAEDSKELSIGEIDQRLRKIICVPNAMKVQLVNRKDDKFSQLVRNIKSHKTSKTNPIFKGYAQDIKGGLRITEKGVEFVKKEFSSRL